MADGYKHVVVLFDGELHSRVRKYAFENNITISDVVRRSVKKTLDAEIKFEGCKDGQARNSQ